MLKHAIKRALAGLAAVVLGTGLAVSTATLAASAVDISDQCVVDVIHHEAVDAVTHEEFQYSKVIPGETETFVTEYRFRTRTVTYGTIEHKYIYSTWDFVSGGQTTINGQVVSGHWVNTGVATWHAIADSVINAVWGAGGVPDNLVGGSEANPKGNVPLTSYGAPGAAGSAPYYASEVSNPSGYTDWGPWSGWSSANPGSETDVFDVESRQTSNNDGTPSTTVYYVPGGAPSATLTDANWTIHNPGAVGVSWTLINQRTITDTEAQEAYDENVYGECPVTPPAVSCFANVVDNDLVLPATPGVLWKVDGGPAVAGPVVIPLTSSDVTVEAVPAPGHLFGPGQTSWKFEVGDDGPCQIATLAFFKTNVTSTHQTCDAGKITGGTITVGMVDGTSIFTNEVDYFLNGSPTPLTQQTVTVAPGTHTVTASPHDPNDSLDGDTSWTVTIASASALCGDLSTLALTGASTPVPWVVLSALLLSTGVAVVATRYVGRRTEVAE